MEISNNSAFRAVILLSALLSAAAHAEIVHMEAIEGGFKTTHGLPYTITGEAMTAKGPKHRTDQFGENPYEISLGALFSDEGVVMIHAERVANQSGASNYENLARSDWPDRSFTHSGAICIDVTAEQIEGEHDLEWLRDNGFDPAGSMVFVQYYTTTRDFNDEIVVTLLARVPACDAGVDPTPKLAPLKESVSIRRAD